MTSPYANKPVLISGCSTGIGHYVAMQLHRRGYKVFASARKQRDVQALKDAGLEAYLMDLRDSDSIRETVKRVMSQTDGKLYALFNNAGYAQPGAVEDLSREHLRLQFETNLFGAMELTNMVIPTMRKQGYGRIIQNSSILGFVSPPFRGAYNASKFALEGLTDAMRLELRGSGIFVSLIQPGPIDSKFRQNAVAQFEEHIDIENSIHHEHYTRVLQRLKKEGPSTSFTLPPSAVYTRVLKALESRRPRLRYSVTFPTYLMRVLKRVLPERVLDALLVRFV